MRRVLTIMRWMIPGVATSLLVVGCGDKERIAQLEKQNEELKHQTAQRDVVTDFDLSAKCSKDAKTWFDANFGQDKDTILLTFTNHYNKEQNKCFVLVEWHYHTNYGPGSWTNHISLWDVYENYKYGECVAQHIATAQSSQDVIAPCELLDKKCKTVEEFDNLIQPYLNK